MRIHSRRCAALLTLSAALAPVASCDDTNVGRIPDDPGPPTLIRIMIQDEGPYDPSASQRNIATDLLDKTPPVCCGDDDPCEATQPACVLPADGKTPLDPSCTEASKPGLCPDLLNPKTTPPAIGVELPPPSPPQQLYAGGGNQIRLVFSKILDLSVETTTTDSAGAIKYMFESGVASLHLGADGPEVPSIKYYDPIGVTGIDLPPTAATPEEIFDEPYGPAIVLKPITPMSAGETYTIQIDPTKIKDKDGQAAVKDVNGPIQSSYSFTTEGLYPLLLNPDLVTDASSTPPTPIATTDAISIAINANIDESTAQASVTVTDASKSPVAVRAFADRAAPACAANLRLLDVLPASGAWAPGQFTLTVSGLKSDTGKVTLKADVTGGADFTIGFTVDPTAMPSNNLNLIALPENCVSPADGGVATDGGTGN